MAIRVTRRVVCDLNDRHTDGVRAWRVTVDRQTKVFDLCERCSGPLRKLWNAHGTARPTREKMHVATLSEIENAKKPPA